MKRSFLIATGILNCLVAFSQNNRIVIKGTVNRLSKSSVLIIQSAQAQIFKIPIKNDNSFFLDTTLKGEGFAFINTDSTASSAVWLAPGEYNITANEIVYPGIKSLLIRTPKLAGPPNAELYNIYTEGLYNITGDSLKQRQIFFVKHLLDSAINLDAYSKVLPNILQMSSGMLDIEDIIAYKEKIHAPADDEVMKQVESEINRRSVTKTGIAFANFTMNNMQGKPFTLSSSKAKLTMIEFWASGCGPCRASHKHMGEIYDKYHDKGLEIVSVSIDDEKKDWQAAVLKDNMKWINVSALGGWDTPLAKQYFISYIPFHVWLDENHNIVATYMSDKDIAQKLGN